MTDPALSPPADHRSTRTTAARGQLDAAAKAHRAAERLEREAAMRRAVFVAALAAFAAVFGLVAAIGKPAATASAPELALAGDAVPAGRVIAEVPVANANGDGVPTIVRIVAPEQGASLPHVRTRATP
jgi:hypothetical protein